MKRSEVAQFCPTLCDPMDCSLPGSSVHGIFQYPGKGTGVGCHCLLQAFWTENLANSHPALMSRVVLDCHVPPLLKQFSGQKAKRPFITEAHTPES